MSKAATKTTTKESIMFEFLPARLIEADDTIRFDGLLRSVSFVNHGPRGSFLKGFDIDGDRGFEFTLAADKPVLVNLSADDSRRGDIAAIRDDERKAADHRHGQYARFDLSADEIREAEKAR